MCCDSRSWLFASSLVLGLGLLGGFGRVIEKYCRGSITALEFFAETDAHAVQYSLIAKSLLATALEYLDKKEAQERLKRTEASSHLFGLIPLESRDDGDRSRPRRSVSLGTGLSGGGPSHQQAFGDGSAATGLNGGSNSSGSRAAPRLHFSGPSPRFMLQDYEGMLLGLSDSIPRTPPEFSIMGGALGRESEHDQVLSALNLFPLLETGGGIDLANYFEE